MKQIKQYDDVPFASWVSEFIGSASKKLKVYPFFFKLGQNYFNNTQ